MSGKVCEMLVLDGEFFDFLEELSYRGVYAKVPIVPDNFAIYQTSIGSIHEPLLYTEWEKVLLPNKKIAWKRILGDDLK